jgi:hypothetical protein
MAGQVKREQDSISIIGDFVFDVLMLDRLLAQTTGDAGSIASMHRVRKDYRQSPVGNAFARHQSKLII